MATTKVRLSPLLVIALAASACAEPTQFLPPGQAGGPQGILAGTVTYAGPLPCTENGHVLGAAVFLAFETGLLPPPEGLGTTAASLGALGGDLLFAGVVDQLTFNPVNNDDPSKSLWCPPDGTSVAVSGDWSVGPLPGGEYEVRGFYDLHGQFDPTFSISKLPHYGDIAGGALNNTKEALLGAAPDYRRVTLGIKQPDGTYTIPPEGANIGGIAVTLGLKLTTGLPIFNPVKVLGSKNVCANNVVMPAPPPSTDPSTLNLPCDYQLPVFNSGDPGGTEDSILRVQLSAGVAPSEVAAASVSPFNFFPAGNPAPSFAFSWQDVNGDGKFDIDHDHSAASSLVPALFPLSIFSKLASLTDDLTPQASPAVILQGLTIYKSLISTVALGLPPGEFTIPPDTDLFVGLTPAVVCLDPANPSSKGKLLLSHLKDCGDADALLTDQAGTLKALSAQFGRPIEIAEGCLPQGRYAMNLVYGTGQAWSVPNEAGVCAASELPVSADGKTCTGGVTTKGPTPRARLTSQDVVLTIGAPSNPNFCVMNPTPVECCPALADATAARVDPATGQCKCPNADPKKPKWACQ